MQPQFSVYFIGPIYVICVNEYIIVYLMLVCTWTCFVSTMYILNDECLYVHINLNIPRYIYLTEGTPTHALNAP